MQATQPIQATVDTLKRLIPLARSPHPFLSAYLPTPADQITTEGIRLSLAAHLDRIGEDLAQTPWERPFREEREEVEKFMRSLRPGGPGLALLSSRQAQEWTALWLPSPVPEGVRFGRGAYVLPLLDLLDEWEPVALAEVHRDKARIMVFAAGRTEEEHQFEAEVPGKHRVGGGAATGYRRAGLQAPGGRNLAAGEHLAGGGVGSRYQRHIETHAEGHLKKVAQELYDVHRRCHFRRLFLAGPNETQVLFKSLLPRELETKLAGELAIDPRHDTEGEIRARILQAAREVERRDEGDLVQEIITRAEKNQGAVVGLAPTLGAINERRVHLLVLADTMDQPGRYCHNCEFILPPEGIICPRCDGKAVKINLWEELPGAVLTQNVRLEVVHGEGAEKLQPYEGIAALLEPITR